MPVQGYVRFPTIYQDSIVFVSEDDLWLISSEGGRAERLTASADRVSSPHFSPDGELLAFVGREEGSSEVYVMPSLGGPAQRLTYQADSSCTVLGWSPDGNDILYASTAGQFIGNNEVIYAIRHQGGEPRQLPLGTANAISYGSDGGVVLGRNIGEPAYWKRYRGGKAGHLWCDKDGDGNFQRLLDLNGNIADPCWVGERIYFLSDHEGIGNIYSCTPSGENLHHHAHQNDFYARSLSTDGRRMVFHAGADLYVFDPQADSVRRLDVILPSQRTQLNRKFVPASSYLNSYALHPQGYSLAVTVRGKAFSMGNWEGAVLQHGEQDGVRYRFLEWLNDGRRLVAISDEPGREVLVIFDPDGEQTMLSDIEFGRAVEMLISPTDDVVAIANHRHELIIVHLETRRSAVLDHSDHERIQGVAWSPDGSWLAYSYAFSTQKKAIKLADLETGETHFATEPVLRDVSPSFDPEGRYLYFLGYRNFNPVRDTLQFDFSFPHGAMPYAITLRNDIRSPFIPEHRAERKGAPKEQSPDDTKPTELVAVEEAMESTEQAEKIEESGEKDETILRTRGVIIDLEGITSRALPFPVAEARYLKVQGIKGRVLFQIAALQGVLHSHEDSSTSKGWIECFDFETQRSERVVESSSSFHLSRDARMLVYNWRRLRVIKAGEKPPRSESSEASGRDTGWIDLGRVKVSVQPAAEWKQMFAEAWRIQREQFWTEDMSGVDWDAIYAQYAPLVERIGSRTELSDLIKELQGELGTSHTYEQGTREYRRGHHYHQGFLGVDWAYDAEVQRYRIARIVRGDTSNSDETSPLTSPGLLVSEGDSVIAVNGQRVGPTRSPQALLVNQSEREVQLTIESAESKEIRTITVETLSDEEDARYREWVDINRRKVHDQSEGKVGYIHIPDMSPAGFAEFHRSYLSEYDYPALIIDVRWNGGGSVSELLLEKLSRRRLGYDFRRWGQPLPYPKSSPRGPMVALTNEHAGSDADVFCHNFKLLGLGPLIGMRTWGGVIGYTSRHTLVDGTETKQPEYAYWFKDVGWTIENYGTNPDIEVDIAPQEYANNIDPQLDRAIAEALRQIDERPMLEPKPGEKPYRGR